MKKRLLFTVLSIFSASIFFSQEWVRKFQDPSANFYDIQQEFESYWSTHDPNEKGKGYKVFRRWEHFVGPRVYPTGNLSQLQLTAQNFESWHQNYMATQATSKTKGGPAQISSATFTAMGPFGAISGNAGNQLLKSGRLNFITIDPNNSSNLWVGAPAGGLWKSTNGGQSWTTNTDQLTVPGCSDLAIDPNNSSIMYLATGDGDAGDQRSVGVLKSTNGGQTWTTTGLTAALTTNLLIRRLIINPANPQVLLAATNKGVYRTTNGGASWSITHTANCYDVEFKPGNPNVVYAAGTNFRLSTDGGQTFTIISSGITTTGAIRMAIAVTPADSQYVYVLAASASGNGFLGMYRSVTAGTTFNLMSSTPNLLGWNTTGSDNGGQGWYDLCVAASPLDRDEVVTGGVNVWKSINGGSSWSIYGHWTGSNGVPFTHADHHDLEYDSTGVLYDCNDGTVYRRTTTGWTEISGNMNISQIYRLGMSALTANKWITGHQDNGTSMWNGTTYNACLGGDGMDCFFDRTNDQVVFGESQYGNLRKSTNGGASWSQAKTGISGSGPWLTPWKQDPQNANTLYCGYKVLYKSTNLAASWSSVTALPNTTSNIIEFAIAPSNNQVIYVLKGSGIYKTTNAGSTWTTVTNGVPVGSAMPQYICIDPNDPNNAWVVLSGYSSGNKVYMTTNGGSTWINYSANLPNIPANCCVYQPGSSDRIYVGMDVGIYYRDANSNAWTLYNAGLPNTPVSELEITPANPSLLYAATYGRGVWVADLVSNAPAVPVTNFSVDAVVKCTNATITFTDLSTNLPNAWNWTISPGSGVSINSPTVQNPQVVFSSTGIYTVQLQADNTLGAGNVVTRTISVLQSPTVTASASAQNQCSGLPVTFVVTGAPSYTWSHSGGSGSSAVFYPVSNTVYSVTGIMNGCTDTFTYAITVKPAPTITIAGPSSMCGGVPVTLTATGSPNYTWSTGSQQSQITVTPAANVTYTVAGTGSNGCKTSEVHSIIVNPAPVFTITSSDTVVCPGQESQLFGAGANSFTWEPGSITGYTFSQVFNNTTTFTLTGTDHKGCSNKSEFTVIVDECAGLSSNEGRYANVVQVYPNPTKDELFLKVGEAPASLEIRMVDLAGKILLSRELQIAEDKIFTLSLREFEQGLYFLDIYAEGKKVQTLHVLKQE